MKKKEKNTYLSPYITVSDGVHCQEVVAVAKLEFDHAGGGVQCVELRLLRHAHLLHEISEQQSIFTHALDGLQEVRRQVHLVAQLHLLPLQDQSERATL